MSYFDAAWLSLLSPARVQAWTLRLNFRERFIIIYFLTGLFLPVMILSMTVAQSLLMGGDLLLLGVINIIGGMSFLTFSFLLTSLYFAIANQRQPGIPLFLIYFIPCFFPLVLILPAVLLFTLFPYKAIIIMAAIVGILWFLVRLYMTQMRYSGIYGSSSILMPILVGILGILFYAASIGMAAPLLTGFLVPAFM